MICPSCGEVLAARTERCPSCRALLAPVVVGAAAPDLSASTPPARARNEPLVPAVRRKDKDRSRDKTWQEEVRDRVKHQRQKRGLPQVAAAAELPLFREGGVASPGSPVERPVVVPARKEPAVQATAPRVEATAPAVLAAEVPLAGNADAEFEGSLIGDRRQIPRVHEGTVLDLPFRAEPPMDRSLVDDLVMDPAEVSEVASEDPEDEPRASGFAALDREIAEAGFVSRRMEIGENVGHSNDVLGEDGEEGEADEEDDGIDAEWDSAMASSPLPGPVSRPARAGERIGAAAVDLALMAGLAITVVYFSSRVAHVSLSGLVPAAPWIAAWIVGVSLAYATFFTGTTGQTLGKIAIGLRVIDTGNRPPTYGRALLRALTGLAGVGLVGAGLVPLLFDPARRTLHDRLCHTRVIRG